MKRKTSGVRGATPVLTAAATLLGVTASLLGATPALADTTVDQALWTACTNGSTGSLSFGAPTVDWLGHVQLTYTANMSSSCFNASVSIVENTPQTNDRPQTFPLANTGSHSGTLTVTPLRSTTWTLAVSSPLGRKVLGTSDIAVNYPSGPLAGAGRTVDITDGGPDQLRRFVQAVETPNTVVRIAGNAELDLSGLDGINVAPGVQIIGDRSVVPQGPRLFTTTFPNNLFVFPHAETPSNERVSGIRLDGGGFDDPFANMGEEDANGFQIYKPGVEIDHDEIYSWRGAGVSVNDQDEANGISQANAHSVWVHDNYIHHNQHPTGDVLGGHGGGYGVSVVHGAYAFVERNVFDYNRHAMEASGKPGSGYYFYDNLILPHGGVNSHLIQTHQIDRHGSDCLGLQCGLAGEYSDIQYNTVWYTAGQAVKLRGTPQQLTDGDKVGMEVRNNAFSHKSLWDGNKLIGALAQTETGLTYSNNQLKAPVGGTITNAGDLDGDNIADPVAATGVTWWYKSSALGGRYVFLNRSGELHPSAMAIQDALIANNPPQAVATNGSPVAMTQTVHNQVGIGIQAFAVGGNGTLYSAGMQLIGNPAVWQAVPGAPQGLKSVGAATDANGTTEVFGIDAFGTIHHSAYGGEFGTWSPWKTFVGQFTSIAAARNQNGKLQVFATGITGEIFTRYQTSAGVDSWTGWQQMQGILDSVAAVTDVLGEINLLGARGGALFWQRQGTVNGDFIGWSKLTQPPVFPHWITASVDDFGNLNIFTGDGNAVYQAQGLNSLWQAVAPAPGANITGAVASKIADNNYTILLGVTSTGVAAAAAAPGGPIGNFMGWTGINGATVRTFT